MVADEVDLEDFNVKLIVTDSFEKGHLNLLVELEIEGFLPIPFYQEKNDHPTIVA